MIGFFEITLYSYTECNHTTINIETILALFRDQYGSLVVDEMPSESELIDHYNFNNMESFSSFRSRITYYF